MFISLRSINFQLLAESCKGYFLSLSVGSSSDYIILGYSGLIELRTYSFDQNAFQTKQFEVYKKANLKIRLHRTLNDNFQSYAITDSNVMDNFSCMTIMFNHRKK